MTKFRNSEPNTDKNCHHADGQDLPDEDGEMPEHDMDDDCSCEACHTKRQDDLDREFDEKVGLGYI